MIIETLFNKGKKNLRKENQEEVKLERFKAIKETAMHQIKNCSKYRQFCKQKNFNPKRDLKEPEDIKNIPYLTTANFKQHSGTPKELLCVPEEQIQVWTRSSGTSGDPSIIGRDKVTIDRYFKMFEFVMTEMCNLPEYQWSLFFQPQPQRRLTVDDEVKTPMNHMGYIFNVANKLPMEDRVYALKLASEEERKKGKLFDFDPEGTFGFLSSNPSEKGRGWIGGSVPLMYKTLSEYHNKTGNTFTVGEDSVICVGGGWKTYSGEAVEPKKFREDMVKILGLREDHIFDVYSFTETDNVHVECEHHNKHLLPWQDIIVRDVETMEPVGIGEKGLANVINPIAYSYCGVSVLQDDIISIVMEDECPCGRKGKVIEIHGRAEGTEARGCGAQIVEDSSN